ncbi:OrNVorf61-like [Venturia canescens]|uniref:OrNVorf61-like n=1 Tax=Venturia canescens TaxID=32260 RepID=A0ACB9ZIC4_9HYME|nr:uncharacterized LOC122408858 [Venturia canescens]KAI5630631.1 OrNVorf61-like [Venturia canescens]
MNANKITELDGASMGYKTPQQSFQEALNFTSEVNEIDVDSKKEISLLELFRKFNDSVITYPVVVLLINTFSVLIIIFQRSLALIIKLIVLVLYVVLLGFTVFTFKNRN